MSLLPAFRSGCFLVAFASICGAACLPALPAAAHHAHHTHPEEEEKEPARTFLVTGTGDAIVPTSIAQIRLGIDTEGKTAEEVQQESARRSSAVVSLLKLQDVEKLRTTGIRFGPVYDPRSNRRRIIGYQASNTISFEVAIEKAGAILDEAVRVGATRIDGLSFTASDEEVAAASEEALVAATTNARRRADKVLAALGLSVQEIRSIKIGSPAPARVEFGFSQNAIAEADSITARTPIESQEQKISASVTLEIRY